MRSITLDLVDETKESLYGRETDRDLCRPVDASRDFFFYFFSERAAWGVDMLPDFLFYFVLFSLFSRQRAGLATCKVVLGLATNMLNVRNTTTTTNNGLKINGRRAEIGRIPASKHHPSMENEQADAGWDG